MNGFANYPSENLGDWGSYGIYAGQPVIYDYELHDVCRAYYGLTFNGTGGYLPQSMIAGEEYTAELRVAVPQNIDNMSNAKVVVMMIDANTGLVVNAACADEIAAVESIDTDTHVTISTLNGNIVVNTINDAQIMVYGTNGAVIATANGQGQITIDTPDGIAIVKVVTAEGVSVKKVLVK